MSLTLSFADASVAQFVVSEKDTSFCVLTRYTALPEVGNGDRSGPFVHVKFLATSLPLLFLPFPSPHSGSSNACPRSARSKRTLPMPLRRSW